MVDKANKDNSTINTKTVYVNSEWAELYQEGDEISKGVYYGINAFSDIAKATAAVDSNGTIQFVGDADLGVGAENYAHISDKNVNFAGSTTIVAENTKDPSWIRVGKKGDGTLTIKSGADLEIVNQISSGINVSGKFVYKDADGNVTNDAYSGVLNVEKNADLTLNTLIVRGTANIKGNVDALRIDVVTDGLKPADIENGCELVEAEEAVLNITDGAKVVATRYNNNEINGKSYLDIAANSTVNVIKNSTLDVSQLINDGTLTIADSTFIAGTVTNNGDFTVKGSSYLAIDNITGAITLNNATLRDGSTISTGSALVLTGKEANFEGNVTVNAAVYAAADKKGTVLPQAHADATRINIKSGAVVKFGSADYYAYQGGFNLGVSDSLDIAKNATLTVTGGTIYLKGKTTVQKGAVLNIEQTGFNNSGNITVKGTVNVYSNAQTGNLTYSKLAGDDNNNSGIMTIDGGTINIATKAFGVSGGYASYWKDNANASQLLITNKGKIVSNAKYFINGTGGTITIQNNSSMIFQTENPVEGSVYDSGMNYNNTKNSNLGVINVLSGSTLDLRGNLNDFTNSGAITVNNATLAAGTITNEGDFTVKGKSTVNANLSGDNAVLVKDAKLDGVLNVAWSELDADNKVIAHTGSVIVEGTTVLNGTINNIVQVSQGGFAPSGADESENYSPYHYNGIAGKIVMGRDKAAKVTLNGEIYGGNVHLQQGVMNVTAGAGIYGTPEDIPSWMNQNVGGYNFTVGVHESLYDEGDYNTAVKKGKNAIAQLTLESGAELARFGMIWVGFDQHDKGDNAYVLNVQKGAKVYDFGNLTIRGDGTVNVSGTIESFTTKTWEGSSSTGANWSETANNGGISNNNGIMNVYSTGKVQINGMNIGRKPEYGTAELNINGGTVEFGRYGINVGYAGSREGLLKLTNGGTLKSVDHTIDKYTNLGTPESVGTTTVEVEAKPLSVGESAKGTLEVLSGSTVDVSVAKIGNLGTVTVNGSTFAAGTITNEGTFSISGGSVTADSVSGNAIQIENGAKVDIGSIGNADFNTKGGKATFKTVEIDNLTGTLQTYGTTTFSGAKINAEGEKSGTVKAFGELAVTGNSVMKLAQLNVRNGGAIKAGSVIDTQQFVATCDTNKTVNFDIAGNVTTTQTTIQFTNNTASKVTIAAGGTYTQTSGTFFMNAGNLVIKGYADCTWTGVTRISTGAYDTSVTVDGTYASKSNNNGKFIIESTQGLSINSKGTLSVIKGGYFELTGSANRNLNNSNGTIIVDNSTLIAGNVGNYGSFTISGKSTVNAKVNGNAVTLAKNTVLTGNLEAVITVSGTASLTAGSAFKGTITSGTLKVAASNVLTITGSSDATLLVAAGDYSEDTFGAAAIKGATRKAEITLNAAALNGNTITNAKVNFNGIAAVDDSIEIKADVTVSDIKSINDSAVKSIDGVYFYNDADGNAYILNKVDGGVDIVEATSEGLFTKDMGNFNLTGNLSELTVTMKSGNTTVKVANGENTAIGTIDKDDQGGVNNVTVGNGSHVEIGTIERMGKITVGKNDAGVTIGNANGTSAAETISIGNGSTFNSGNLDFATGKATFKLGKDAKANIGDYIVYGSSNTITLGANVEMTTGRIINYCGNNYDAVSGTVKYAPAAGTTISLAKGADMKSSDVIGLAGLTLAGGSAEKRNKKGVVTAKEVNTTFTAKNVYGTEKNNTINIGNYGIFSADSINLFSGNDTVKIAQAGTVKIGAIDFGAGKDTLSIGKNSKVELSSIAGLETLNASKGATIRVNNGAEDFNDLDGVKGTWKNAALYDMQGELEDADSSAEAWIAEISGSTYGNEWDLYTFKVTDNTNDEISLIGADSNDVVMLYKNENGNWREVGMLSPATIPEAQPLAAGMYAVAVNVAGADMDKRTADDDNSYAFQLQLA